MPSIFQVSDAHSVAQLLNGRDPAALQQLRALNPHLADLHAGSTLKAGTVLLLPDTPGFAGVGQGGIGAASWAQLASDATAGFRQRTERVQAALAERETQRQEVLAVMSRPEVVRQLDADADLRQQADAATARFRTEQASDAASAKQFDALGQSLAEELARLQALFSPAA